MSIKDEGNYDGIINAVEFIKGRFSNNPDVIEVKIGFDVAEIGSDCTYLSLDSYTYGSGAKSSMTKQQLTLETLRDLGCDDLQQVATVLIGKPISIYSTLNAKGYINHYVSKSNGSVLSASQVMAELFGQAPIPAQAQVPAQAQAPIPAQAQSPIPAQAPATAPAPFDANNF